MAPKHGAGKARGRLRVAVAGGGLGGLSAASWLRKAGHEVVLLEASPRVGGKAGRVQLEGYRFDAGPTLLTLPEALRETFAAVGGDLDADVGLTRLEPVCRYFFPGGRRFDVGADEAASVASIDRAFAGEGARYRALLERSRSLWRHAGEPYLEAPYRGSVDFLSRVVKRGPGALRLSSSLDTLASLGRGLFRTPELRAFLGRFATYCGGDPEKSSATYAMIPHLEHELGAYHPRGGMHAVALALAHRLEQAGVTVRTRAPVEELLLQGSRVVGVRAGGHALRCDAVVANVDPEVVLSRWLPRSAKALARAAGLEALRGRERSLSGYALLLGVEGAPAELAHHNVLFPADYGAEFRALFEQGTVCPQPTLYVCNSAGLEADAAPPGCASLFVLVNAPPLRGDAAPEDGVDLALEERVLALLDTAFPGLRSRVRVRARVTPAELARLGSPGGAIYGEAPHGVTAPFRRVQQRCAALPGLYFVGGSVHPGGGVPMVTLGGRHAATLLEEDCSKLQSAEEGGTAWTAWSA